MKNPISTFAWNDLQLDDWLIPQENILEGQPDASGSIIYMTNDKTSCSGIWQCKPGKFRWEYTWNESIYIISGRGKIFEESGAIHELSPGKMVHFNMGLKSTWVVEELIQKFFALQSEVELQL